jgi:hypothetical protein
LIDPEMLIEIEVETICVPLDFSGLSTSNKNFKPDKLNKLSIFWQKLFQRNAGVLI